MDFAGIKKAMIDYATEVETGSQKIKTSYSAIANVLSDMQALENKWVDGADNIEASIQAIPDAAVRASYEGQLNLFRAQRQGIIDMLTALDAAVESAGLMLI